MTTYYVNNTLPTASNSNAGTSPSLPWLTISKAASTLIAGDTVLVGPSGTYDERVIPSSSGGISTRITYLAATGTRPIVRGFTLTGKSYITIQGFEITNQFMSADSNASVIVTGTTGVYVVSNYIHDTNAIAVRANPNNASAKCSGLIVRSNTMTRIGPAWNGIQGAPGRFPIVELWGDDSLVELNDMSYGDDFLRPFGSRNVYRNNTLHDSQESQTTGGIGHIDGFQSYCNGTPSQAANYLLVEGNVMENNEGVNTHFGLINSTSTCGGSTTVIVRHNVITNNGSFTYVADTNGGLADNHKVYNNTVVDASRTSHSNVNLDGCTYGAVLNNIFQDAISPSAPAQVYLLDNSGTSKGDHNLAYMTAFPSQVWANPINSETGRILNQSPLLDSSFELETGSPAIASAGALTTVAAADTGSGTTLVLTDAHFFQPGWAGTTADRIAVGSFSNQALIVSINYATNTVTLAAGLTRSDGDPVYLYANSSGTVLSLDRGAYPYDVTPPPPAPVAAFSATPLSGQAPLTVTFTDASTGTPTSWAWQFENNGITNSVAQSPSTVYSAAGTYSVKLTATNAGGSDSETKLGYITVSAPPAPVAAFSGTPLSGEAPLSVTFTDASTNAPTSWAWEFENNGIVNSTTQSPTTVYSAAGTYGVKLTATNASGSDSEVKLAYITVSAPAPPPPPPAPPVTNFVGVPLSGVVPLQVSFTDTSTNTPTSWAWDFQNNGSTDSTSQNPSKVYMEPGTYSVKLTATNADGSDSETKTSYVTASAVPLTPPVTNFTGTPLSGVIPLSVAFTDSSTNTPTSWSWDFENDGGVDSTSQNPTKVYTTAGVYTVSLIATNADGSDTLTRLGYITALETPPTPPTPPSEYPTPGDSGQLTTSCGKDNAVISWVRATDIVTPQSSLQYEVRQSSTPNIGSLALAELNGTIIKAYSSNLSSCNAVSLRSNTVYYFNVIVKDAAGNKSAYTMTSARTRKRNWQN